MRHRIDKKFYNRDTKSRRSLINGVTVAVLEHGEVITTKAKAKEAMRLIDTCISKAKVGDLAARRTLHRIFGRRDVVNNLCERVAPAMKDRQSGFTRLTVVGNRRGDNTLMYRLSLVEVLPTSKKIADQEKKAAAKKETKTAKTEKKVKKSDDRAAKAAIAHDQLTAEKATSANVSKSVTGKAMPRKTFGGGRGK